MVILIFIIEIFVVSAYFSQFSGSVGNEEIVSQYESVYFSTNDVVCQ